LERHTRRFLVTGKVQGVYFRQSTRVEAERLAIRGVARNLPDGSVEVIAHGSLPAVEQLREWLHRGPSRARVAAVRELEILAEHLAAERFGDEADRHPAPSFRVE